RRSRNLVDREAALAALRSEGLAQGHGRRPRREIRWTGGPDPRRGRAPVRAHLVMRKRGAEAATTEMGRMAAEDPSRIRDRDPASFDTETLQQIIYVRKRHQNLARLGALVAADHAVLGELVDDAARARVADVELALDQRHRRATFSRDRASRACKQRVELALQALASTGPLRTGALLEDLLHVSRRALRFPEADDRFDLGI